MADNSLTFLQLVFDLLLEVGHVWLADAPNGRLPQGVAEIRPKFLLWPRALVFLESVHGFVRKWRCVEIEITHTYNGKCPL